MRLEHTIGFLIILLLAVDVYLTYQIYLGKQAVPGSGVSDGT